MTTSECIKLVNDIDASSHEGLCLLRSKSRSKPEKLHALGTNGHYVCSGGVCVRDTSGPTDSNRYVGRTAFLGNSLDVGEETELLIADIILNDDMPDQA